MTSDIVDCQWKRQNYIETHLQDELNKSVNEVKAGGFLYHVEMRKYIENITHWGNHLVFSSCPSNANIWS